MRKTSWLPFLVAGAVSFAGTVAAIGTVSLAAVLAGILASALVGGLAKLQWDVLIANPLIAGLTVVLAVALFGFFAVTRQGLFESAAVAVVFVTVALLGLVAQGSPS